MIEYFEKRASQYHSRSQRGIWHWFRAREFNAIVQHLDVRSGHRVLDLGCGAGYYSLGLSRLYDINITAVDSSPGMITELKRRKGDFKIDARLADLSTFQTEVKYNRILLAGVLEFISEIDPVFFTIKEALELDGIAAILVPTYDLTGRAYQASHIINGCPTILRSPSDYLLQARKFGLELKLRKRVTPMSEAFFFIKSR